MGSSIFNKYDPYMNDTYEYDFIRVKLKGVGLTGKFSEDYQKTINDRARIGWRFVQSFAPAVVGYGASKYVNLIFERPTAKYSA